MEVKKFSHALHDLEVAIRASSGSRRRPSLAEVFAVLSKSQDSSISELIAKIRSSDLQAGRGSARDDVVVQEHVTALKQARSNPDLQQEALLQLKHDANVKTAEMHQIAHLFAGGPLRRKSKSASFSAVVEVFTLDSVSNAARATARQAKPF